MSLLRPISIFLRNALVKQHPYFSCCASCGEIKTPLGKRLCTSLTCSVQVDAVVLAADASEALLAATIRQLHQHCSWLRAVFLVTASGTAHALPSFSGELAPRSITEEAFLDALTVPEGGDSSASLSECLLLLQPGGAPQQKSLPHDFFTPNGLPLVRLLPPDGSEGITWKNFRVTGKIIPLSKNAVRDFLNSPEAPSDPLRCTQLWARASCWTLDKARAIPAKA